MLDLRLNNDNMLIINMLHRQLSTDQYMPGVKIGYQQCARELGRPSGTSIFKVLPLPALKRWAKIGRPSGGWILGRSVPPG